MKKIIILICFLLLPAMVRAAAITSAQAGNWSSTSTWTGGTVPGDGDTATIAHAVSVDVATTIGDSGATGTVAVAVTGGSLTINQGVELTCRGDLTFVRNTTVTVSGTLNLDAPSGATYTLRSVPTGSSFANFRATGSTGNYAVIKRGDRGGIANIDFGATPLYADFRADYARFEDLGTTSVPAIYHYMFLAASHNEQTKVVWLRCGEVKVNLVGADRVLNWDGVDIRSPLNSSFVLSLTATTDNTTGVRSIKNITVYSEAVRSISMNARDLETSAFIVYNGVIAAGAGYLRGTIDESLIAGDAYAETQLALVQNSSHEFVDSIFVKYALNPHYWGEVSTNAGLNQNEVNGVIFDGTGYQPGDSGDCIIPKNSVYITKVIAINKAGTLAPAASSGSRITAVNNTMYNAHGIQVGETTGAATQIVEVSNNLFVSQADGVHQSSNFVSQSGFELHHNAYYDMTDSDNIDYGGNNTYLGEATYDDWWESGSYGDSAKGSDDLYINPEFFDPSRTVLGYGGWATVQDMAREMVSINGIAYDGTATTATTKSVPAITAYIREGFTPQNLDLLTAGEGGTYIGAVEPEIVSSGAPAALILGF